MAATIGEESGAGCMIDDRQVARLTSHSSCSGSSGSGSSGSGSGRARQLMAVAIGEGAGCVIDRMYN